MLVTIATIIYIASVIGAYLLLRKAYLPGGRWQRIRPGLEDLLVVFIPALNTVHILFELVYMISDSIKSPRQSSIISRFFGLSKK